MNKINRILTNICSDKLSESKSFYTTLFDFKVEYDSDWFIQLISQDGQLELGIIERSNQIVPKAYQNNPQGFYLTFVLDRIEEVFDKAKTRNVEIVEAPHDTPYGQRRLLLKDPNGVLIDVSAPM